jgi:dTDP-4-dehydrorhamnose reductase
MMIAEALEKRLTGVYHMAGVTRVTRFEMAKAIAEAFQLEGPLIEPVKMEELSWKARRPRDSSLDVSKARGALENRPLELGYALKLLKAEMASPVKS